MHPLSLRTRDAFSWRMSNGQEETSCGAAAVERKIEIMLEVAQECARCLPHVGVHSALAESLYCIAFAVQIHKLSTI